MSNQIPNVRTWSKTVPSYLFDLADLDVYVLKEHPAAVAAMGRARRADRRDLRDLAVIALLVLAPLGAVFAGGGRLPSGLESDGLARSGAGTLAAWCFGVAVLGTLLVAWQWWRRERHWEAIEVVGLIVSFVAGLATLGLMGSDYGVDVFAFELPSIPVWFDVVASAVVGVLVAVASRGRGTAAGRHFGVTGQIDTDRVRVLVDGLDVRRREKLLDERRRAIARLRDRNLIDDREAAEVGSLPLGWSPTLHGAGDRAGGS